MKLMYNGKELHAILGPKYKTVLAWSTALPAGGGGGGGGAVAPAARVGGRRRRRGGGTTHRRPPVRSPSIRHRA